MIHKIKALYDEGRGESIRAIASQLTISRNTVRKYLRMDETTINRQQRFRERSKRLDQQRDYIRYLLRRFPKLNGVKILRKLKEKYPGLEVSDRTVRRYVQRLKQCGPYQQERYYEPILDMVPGIQCQVDGGELRGTIIGGVESVIYFVVFVLSYSRLMYVGLSPTPVNTAIFIQMHDAAFRYFGGRPEECVYDQAKLVVLHEQYRELDLNPQFHTYATTAGFRIHACAGYDPESKGKVESGVKYVKNNALYGDIFDDWQHLESHVTHWLETIANVRIHGTTKEQPRLRYEQSERAHMQPYFSPDPQLLQPHSLESRKVDKTGLLSWRSNKYSAPLVYQQTQVAVQEKGTRLILHDLETGEEIARHHLCTETGKIVKNNDHYRDKQATITHLEETIIIQLGEQGGSELCALLKQSNPRIYKDQLTGLLSVLKQYEMPTALLDRLCHSSRLTVRQIRDYLEASANHPQRLLSGQAVETQAVATIAELNPYAAIKQQYQEVLHEHIH